MITKTYVDSNIWMQDRMGKITGSKLKGVITKRGNGKKIGYWSLIAENFSIPELRDINPRQRGMELEEEAVQRFMEATGKVVDRTKCLWMREDNEKIALSPDGVISETEALEVKCLNSANHVEALVTGKTPDEYVEQVLQYFIVNDKLETLYFAFFDPRMTIKHFFYHTIHRLDVQTDVEMYLELEREILLETDAIVKDLELSEF